MYAFKKKVAATLVAVWLGSLVAGAASTEVEAYLHRRAVLPGSSEYQAMEDLFGAQQYPEAIAEGRRTLDGNKQGDYGPRILFLSWRASHELNDRNAATRTENEFWCRYPRDPLAADLRFAAATGDVAHGEKDAAITELSALIGNYTNASIRPFAVALLEQIDAETK